MDAAEGHEAVVETVYPVSEPTPEPTLTVAAVARRMGVAAPTLRTWDRRYGLGPSAHTAGAHRRYTSADVSRLLLMRRLTLEGVSPADAARIAKATPVASEQAASVLPDVTPPAGIDVAEATGVPAAAVADTVPDFPGVRAERPFVDLTPWGQDTPGQDGDDLDEQDLSDIFSESDLVDARRARRADPDPEDDVLDAPWRDEPGAEIESEFVGVLREAGGVRSSAGGGRVVAMPYGTPASRGLARAAMSLDTVEINRILVDGLRREGTIRTWTSMIMPVLRALGERTQVTGDGIDVEHAFSEAVLGAFRGVSVSLQRPRNPAPVLLAGADGDYHSLPIHALGAALAERQVGARMLGSGLPPHAIASSVRRTGPSVIVIYARMPGADARPVESLRRQRPAPTVVLAGPGWRPETVPPAARQASSLTEAVDEVMLGVHL